MRFKRRYFCVELLIGSKESKLKPGDLSQEINRSIERLYGDYGAAKMQPSFSLIYFNTNTNLAIFRIARESRVAFHQLLTFVRRIESTDLTFKVIHVAGSIKKCKKFLIDYSNRRLQDLYMEQLKGGFATNRNESDRAVVEVLEKLIKTCEEDGENFY